MATVYLTEDLRHDRKVAIKVLRPELAAVLGADRFVQEIKTTANLQHAHILPLFDSGEADGFVYYVMPYVEGESLREKLNRETQLGIDEAVRIATDVADALDYAHQQDVIHRDIKPENILLQSGEALVADFGIALAVSAAGGTRLTETGLSLGTPHYMSPEQATAEKDLTNRSDIYSLGAVLYEMLTGDPPHMGGSAQQIIMKIVTEEIPPVTKARKKVPTNVAAAVMKSLEKLPADRFESARTFAAALGDPAFATPATEVVSGVARARERWYRLAVGFAAVAVVATVAGVWGWLRPVTRDVDRSVVEFYLDPPDSAMVFGAALVLSPDGRRLVAEGIADQGWMLYQRTLDSPDWRAIPGTEGALSPFFSPDGEWLAFFSTQEGAIKRIPVEGGSAQTITQASQFQGASWGPDNTVVFTLPTVSGKSEAGLFRVSAYGGVPEQLTAPDRSLREALHLHPHYLSSGEVVLFTSTDVLGQEVVAALSLESGKVSRLTAGMTPLSDRTGRVVYVTPDGSAVAQMLNPRTLSLEGPPRPIAEGIAISFGVFASYTVSADGSLAYLSGSGQGDQLYLVSREGETRPLYSPGVGTRMWVPRFSPSGDRLALARAEGGGGSGDVWVYSFARGTAQRLSFEGPSSDPAWTTDGRSIGYSVAGEGDGSFASLYLRAADGTGSAEQILAGDDHLWQLDFAPGDREIVMYASGNLFRASLGNDSGPVPLMETESFIGGFTLSPDGRWIAYRSDGSGTDEIYVRSYPDLGPPTVVSIGGGRAAAWSGDGSEIFYRGRGWIVAASLRYDGPRVTVVERTELFRTSPFQSHYNRNYAVHPNGQEFVVVGRSNTRIVWRVNALAEER
jgi:serine/threonine-protein kinase